MGAAESGDRGEYHPDQRSLVVLRLLAAESICADVDPLYAMVSQKRLNTPFQKTVLSRETD